MSEDKAKKDNRHQVKVKPETIELLREIQRAHVKADLPEPTYEELVVNAVKSYYGNYLPAPPSLSREDAQLGQAIAEFIAWAKTQDPDTHGMVLSNAEWIVRMARKHKGIHG